MACVDIIIVIHNYDPQDTYQVAVRLVASVANPYNLPTYTQTATGPQVIFHGLPEGLYEAAIIRTCVAGGQSGPIWQTAMSPSCIAPQNVVVSNITATDADVDWDGTTGQVYEISVNEGDWEDTDSHNAHAITGLTAGISYDIRIRQKCGTYMRSPIVNKHFTTTVGVPSFNSIIIRKICEQDQFLGFKIRFNISGGLATVGEEYQITYTALDSSTTVVANHIVTGSDTLSSVINSLASFFTPVNLVVGATYAYFDVVVKPELANETTASNCNNVEDTNPYSTAII